MAAADRDLLFGLLALQNGLIDQVELVAAFQAWTREKARSLADHLENRGDIDGDDRAAVEALVGRHLKKHGGDTAKSVASIPAGPATRARLEALGDAELTAMVANVRPGSTEADSELASDRTTTYDVGSSTSDGHRFRVLRPHARGGLGAVFVALDSELHREVALKEILAAHADDPVSRQRFLLEAEVTGGLEHPSIVPVYGLGTYGDGRPYYAMRFIKGDSLKDAIAAFHADASLSRDRGARSLALRKLLMRFLDVCNAIGYAHSRGVLHRDIKPGNIIVGKHGETLVVDWGLAKPTGHADPSAGERTLVPSSASGSSETLPGSALGTPAYMSPEQAAGDFDRLGPTADVYSLGATLYCLLTGKPPFEGDDVGAILRSVQKGEFQSPRRIDPSIDRPLEAICLKAMALKPEDRYPGVKPLADDVERWVADEPVSSYRDPVATRLTRWGRRHRSLAASVAALLVSAVVGLSIGALLINGERAKADANFRQARAAVDEYFTTVSESRLLNVPGLQPLRKELLDSAMRYYRDFLSQRSHDSAVRVETASATFRVGWINMTLGRPNEALEPLRTATELYEALERSDPSVTEYRRLSAIGHGALGLLLTDLGHLEEAMREHRNALEIRQVLAKLEPKNPLVGGDVARSHRNIGNLHRQVGKTQEALAEWEIAGSLGRALLAGPLPRGPGRTDLTGRRDPSAILREDLGGVELDRAGVLGEIGRHAEAQDAWRQARELFEGLVRESPDDQALIGRLAGCESEGALLLLDLGRFEESADSLRRALELRKQLAAANPAVAGYRVAISEDQIKLAWILKQHGRKADALAMFQQAASSAEALAVPSLLAQCLTQSSNVLVELGRSSEAVPMARRALEIQDELARDQPLSVSQKSTLANVLRGVGRAEASAGRPEEARRAFERAAEIERSLAETYPGSRYNVACSLALLIPVVSPGRREAIATQAMNALEQCVAAGYANVAIIRSDPDLDALRRRADCQNFLLDLGFPRNPFARGL
jgi:eukaryotic-like serine/threonine-protein kinase